MWKITLISNLEWENLPHSCSAWKSRELLSQSVSHFKVSQPTSQSVILKLASQSANQSVSHFKVSQSVSQPVSQSF
jgi:hypothetical protein